MTAHECRSCGIEYRCSHGIWSDRHPVAAAVFALPALFFLVSVMLAYPWFTIPVTVIVAAVLVNRAQRRRAAAGARAEHEYQAQLLRELQRWPAGLPAAMRAPVLAPGRVRGADHWSITKPVRSGRR